MKQMQLLKSQSKSYGGQLRNTRKGRSGGRTLTTQSSIHLVLRSSKAIGEKSFLKPRNKEKIREIIKKHAEQNHIFIIKMANVGNHLHLQVRLFKRHSYFRFIRSITGAIALFILKADKNTKVVKTHSDRFWDYRPFTRIITGFKDFIGLRDYIAINELEGRGHHRMNAEIFIKTVRTTGPPFMLKNMRPSA